MATNSPLTPELAERLIQAARLAIGAATDEHERTMSLFVLALTQVTVLQRLEGNCGCPQAGGEQAPPVVFFSFDSPGGPVTPAGARGAGS